MLNRFLGGVQETQRAAAFEKGEEAERVGFEPTRRLFTAYAISNRAP